MNVHEKLLVFLFVTLSNLVKRLMEESLSGQQVYEYKITEVLIYT